MRMKAVLEFNLPEEQEEYSEAINGSKYKSALQNIFNIVRYKLKYEDMSEEEGQII